MIRMQDEKTRIYLLLLALIFVWGLSWPISKIGLQYMPPLWFVLYRLLIGTVTMFLIVAFLKKLVLPRKQDLKIIIIIGLLQVGLFLLFLTIGLYYVEAGRAAILVYTTPIWVVPISIFFFKEKSTVMKWLGFIFGTIGIAILFNPLAMNWHNPNILFGNEMLLLAALCWAIAILCARHMVWPRKPLELISWQLLVGTIPVVLLTIIKQPHPHIIWNHSVILALCYNGVLSTGFAYWGTVVVSKELPSITTSLSLLMIPVCGVITSWLILGDVITQSVIVAMFCILLGVVCVIMSRDKKSNIKGVSLRQ